MTMPATERTGDVQSAPAADPAASGDREAIERDIEQTRAQLGETVDALTSRLDVKSRLKEKASTGSQRMRSTVAAGGEQAKQHAPVTAVAALALVATILGIVVWKSHR
ncbi:MAG: DUF3618 domain-containing protein [Nocardioidaceae bacterium]